MIERIKLYIHSWYIFFSTLSIQVNKGHEVRSSLKHSIQISKIAKWLVYGQHYSKSYPKLKESKT